MPALMIWWKTRTPGVILSSVFEPAVAALAEVRDYNGCKANHVACRRWRPYGAVAWAESPSGPWRPMAECPIPEEVVDTGVGGVNGKPMMSKYGR